MMKRTCLYILIGVMANLTVMAQPQFRTMELQRLANVLALDANTLAEGYSYPMANGLGLIAHVSGKTVDHIGLHLFSDELRTMGQSPIFDFLERYFLQLKYPPVVKTASSMMRDDEFRFVVGTMSSIDEILPSDDFSFTNDNRRYTATWRRNGQALLSVSFPVEYELISGENKIEAEDNLYSDILNAPLVSASSDNSQRNGSYINSCFSNRLYYQNGKLIASGQHPAETASNMMLSMAVADHYKINVNQVSYGFRKKEFQVPLRQWISFCRNSGCQLYFGIEHVSDSGDVSAVVIAVNQSENYNHVLTVTIPSAAISRHQALLEGRLYPYIPTHNVMNMFANFRKSNPKSVAK